MAKVVITKSLQEEIYSKFKEKSEDIFLRMKNLETRPSQGKALGHIGGIVIKEIKHEKFRFYFITNGHILKFGSADELARLLIKFVKMSEKKDQRKAIATVKNILKSLGFEGF